jgi:pimeloyl-ACP methyl ester carboxylesterase
MIYYISGLGADERVFKYLNLGDLEYTYIKWETPQKYENLEGYCSRLIKQIDLSKEIILVGVSFGGIVAQEISKIIKHSKVIILSSVKSVNEFNWQLDIVRRLKLYKLAPSKFLKWSNKLTGDYYFGVKTHMESELLKQIISDTDRFFMKWAIQEIMEWDGNSINSKIVHIHGDNDRIFPVKRIKNYIRINGGGHFMIVNRADEISEIIKNEIKNWA